MSALTGFSLVDTRTNGAAAHVLTELPILVLNVHSRCNCRCVMCDIWKRVNTQELRPADLLPHLDSIRRLGVRSVVFSGGEPLMNPGLFELAALLRRDGIALTLLSTGLLLRTFAKQVAEHFSEVILSLDGPPEIHDSIRRVPGAFDRLAGGVAAIRALQPELPVHARTTVQKLNHLRLRDTVLAARNLQLNSISFLAADVTSQAFNRELVWPVERQSQIALTLEEISNLESELDLLVREHPHEFKSGFIAESPDKLRRIVHHFRAQLGLESPLAPRCNAPWVSAVIEADGTIRPCFFHPPIAYLNDDPLETALNSPEALAFRSTLDVETNPTCQRCVCSLNYNPTISGGRHAPGIR